MTSVKYIAKLGLNSRVVRDAVIYFLVHRILVKLQRNLLVEVKTNDNQNTGQEKNKGLLSIALLGLVN